MRERNEIYTNYDVPLVEIICIRTPEGAVALLFQEPLHYRISAALAIYDELRESVQDFYERNVPQEEVVETLKHYGFNAAIGQFAGGKLREEDVAFILSLSFTAQKKEWKEDERFEV